MFCSVLLPDDFSAAMFELPCGPRLILGGWLVVDFIESCLKQKK